MRRSINLLAAGLLLIAVAVWLVSLRERNGDGPPGGAAFASSKIAWRGPFGAHVDGRGVVYMLLLRDGLQAGNPAVLDEAIERWMARHPEAVVIPVAWESIEVEDGRPMYTCHVWVEAGGESLNLHLIEQGRVKAATMVFAGGLLDVHAAQGPGLLVSAERYNAFHRAALEAELRARTAMRGVWAATSGRVTEATVE